MSKKYYLSGPMSGIAQFNYPLFERVAKVLRDAGYAIISPAELDHETEREAARSSANGGNTGDRTWGDFLARDVRVIADEAHGIILLPGWERSRGARLEAFLGLLHPAFDFLRWDDQSGQPVPVARHTVQNEIHCAWETP